MSVKEISITETFVISDVKYCKTRYGTVLEETDDMYKVKLADFGKIAEVWVNKKDID